MRAKLLIYGIGNPGREDDGLGYEFVARLGDSPLYEKRHAYQLNIEDAELFTKYEKILFVDAGKNLKTDFAVMEIVPKPESFFSTHGLNMQAVLAMTAEIYQKRPVAQLLCIRAESFALNLALTNRAQTSLNKSMHWFKENLSEIVTLTH